MDNCDTPTIDGVIATWVRPGSLINTDGAAIYKGLLTQERFGEYNGQNGLGGHLSINHSEREYSARINRDFHGHRVRNVLVTTNHIEATWHQLKENIASSSEFFDHEGELVRMINGYIDRYIYFRRV